MTIKVVCACGKMLSVKDDQAGEEVKCPACQRAQSAEILDDEIMQLLVPRNFWSNPRDKTIMRAKIGGATFATVTALMFYFESNSIILFFFCVLVVGLLLLGICTVALQLSERYIDCNRIVGLRFCPRMNGSCRTARNRN